MRISSSAVVLVVAVVFGGMAWADGEIGLTYGGKSLQGESLPPGLRQKLYELEVELKEKRQQAMDEYVYNSYMRDQAQRRKISVQQLREELLEVDDPSDKEVSQFYEANRSRIRGALDEVKPQLIQFLKNQTLAARQAGILEQIRREKGYSVSLPEPVAPRFEVNVVGYPSKGNDAAKVTIVEFADYQCPHCSSARTAIDNLLKRYDGQIRVVYRDFPVNPSGVSRKVSVGAVCAREQGKFWEYHDLAFDRQDYLKVITPDMLAKELGLDESQFSDCYARPDADEKVAASKREAEQLGLTGTPSFLVNGLKLHIHGDIESALAEAVEQALSEGS